MSILSKVTFIRNQIDVAEEEIKSLEQGKKIAGARGRKAVQTIKNLSTTLRKDIIDYNKKTPKEKS